VLKRDIVVYYIVIIQELFLPDALHNSPLKGDTVYTLKINKVPLKSIGDNILHMPTFFV